MNQLSLELGEDQNPTIHQIACGEQPQQRMEIFGAAALSDTELLTLMLQSGLATKVIVDAASQLIAEAGSFRGFINWQPVDFEKLKGIGRVKARQLTALVEIARRMMNPHQEEAPVLSRPEIIVAHMSATVRSLEIEKFFVLCLNRKNRLLKQVEITSGTATSALAHPREVFRAAIRYSATAVICVHNHPSGDPAPSAADIHVTRQLREAAKAVDIDLVDHVIIGRSTADPLGLGFYSFRHANLL